tara:strand:- start:229 stop:579 length:351 start_codon:yes stop_codon:yes gene_type:complete
MKRKNEIKTALTLILSGAILVWSFLLTSTSGQIHQDKSPNKSIVKQLGFVDFYALPTVYEDNNPFKDLLIDGLFEGIKNQEFSWVLGPLIYIKSLTRNHWVSYYFKQILFPFHSFW